MSNLYHRFVQTGLLLALIITTTAAQKMFKMQGDKETRWTSFENSMAGKGKGGSENKKVKGHPSEFLTPGETKVLMNVSGAGII